MVLRYCGIYIYIVLLLLLLLLLFAMWSVVAGLGPRGNSTVSASAVSVVLSGKWFDPVAARFNLSPGRERLSQ